MNFEKPSFISPIPDPCFIGIAKKIKYGVDCVNIGSTNLTKHADVLQPNILYYLFIIEHGSTYKQPQRFFTWTIHKQGIVPTSLSTDSHRY